MTRRWWRLRWFPTGASGPALRWRLGLEILAAIAVAPFVGILLNPQVDFWVSVSFCAALSVAFSIGAALVWIPCRFSALIKNRARERTAWVESGQSGHGVTGNATMVQRALCRFVTLVEGWAVLSFCAVIGCLIGVFLVFWVYGHTASLPLQAGAVERHSLRLPPAWLSQEATFRVVSPWWAPKGQIASEARRYQIALDGAEAHKDLWMRRVGDRWALSGFNGPGSMALNLERYSGSTAASPLRLRVSFSPRFGSGLGLMVQLAMGWWVGITLPLWVIAQWVEPTAAYRHRRWRRPEISPT